MFDVSASAPAPYRWLSPASYSVRIEIPVPGMSGKVAHSVEGLWQGLKVIAGCIDETRFVCPPAGREGSVEGFRLGDQTLSLVEARWKIYIPAYFHYLNHFAPQEALATILSEQEHGKKVYLHDVAANGNLARPEPYAHAAALALYLNLRRRDSDWRPRDLAEERLLEILDGQGTIEGRASRLQPLLEDETMKRAVLHFCDQNPREPEHYRIGKVLALLA